MSLFFYISDYSKKTNKNVDIKFSEHEAFLE
jgi:hypothetical protein